MIRRAGEIARLLKPAAVLEPFLSGPAAEVAPADQPPWSWIGYSGWSPSGCLLRCIAALKPSKPTEVHWLPAALSCRIELLKKALALRLMEKISEQRFRPSDLNLLREETKSTMANLFRELICSAERSSQGRARNPLTRDTWNAVLCVHS